MGFWAILKMRLFAPPNAAPPDVAPAPPPLSADATEAASVADSGLDTSPTVAARQERAASRILENERLRGDLADDEYQPLLDWALTVTDRVAASTADLEDEAADERIGGSAQVLGEILEAASYAIVAHNEGDADRRRRELEFIADRVGAVPLGQDDAAALATMTGQLATLADRLDAAPELSGADVAQQIADALTQPEGTEAMTGADERERPPDAGGEAR